MDRRDRPKCGGPGGKEIFETRAEALKSLRDPNSGRRASPRQGGVHRCSWGGGHYHITSKGKRGR